MRGLVNFLLILLLCGSVVLNYALLEKHGNLMMNVQNYGIVEGFGKSVDRALGVRLHLSVDKVELVEGA